MSISSNSVSFAYSIQYYEKQPHTHNLPIAYEVRWLVMRCCGVVCCYEAENAQIFNSFISPTLNEISKAVD